MNDWKNARVGVLMGGPSAESEVSLQSGKNVLAALQSKGYQAIPIKWSVEATASDLGKLLQDAQIEVVWNALHGTYGEDGAVQGLLECYRIPYTGSGILASAIAMDKIATRRVFDQESIESPRWRPYRGAADAAYIGYPMMVKPSCEGSSVGISLVKKPQDLAAAVKNAASFHGIVLLEEYIAGREINVAVLNDEVIGDVEIRPATEFYDYEAKYTRDDTVYVVPAEMTAAERQLAHGLALRAHRALGCSGATRVDLLVTAQGRAVCLEINTLPGMTDHSLLPKIARARGMGYGDLVEAILQSADLKLLACAAS